MGEPRAAAERTRRVTGIAIALVGAIVLALLLWTTTFESPPLDPVASPVQRTAPTTFDAARIDGANDDRESARVPPAPSSRPAGAATAATATVRGRCVDAATGAPLAGCRAAFDGWPTNAEDVRRHGPFDWTDPEPVVTGADGRFVFRFEPPQPYQHGLDVTAPDRVRRSARWGTIAPGAVVDVGDVELVRGYSATGRVVDERGTAVPSVTLEIDGLPTALAAGHGSRSSARARSNVDGQFAFHAPLPVGRWPLSIETDSYELVSPDALDVAPSGVDAETTVVVRTLPSIAGVAVDEDGEPLRRIRVEASSTGTRILSDRTDVNGRFRVFANRRDEPAPTVHVNDDAFEPVAVAAVDWGTNDLRIELRRRLSLLVDARTANGEPVTDFVVFNHRDTLRLEPVDGVPGQARAFGLPRGTARLSVVPRDPWLAPSPTEEREVESASDAAPLRVTLDALVPLDVRVVDADGRAFADSTVVSVLLGTEPVEPDEFWPADRWAGAFDPAHHEHRGNFELGRATTDQDGRARVPVRAIGANALWITSAAHLPHVERGVASVARGVGRDATTERVVDVVVSRGGVVRGTVRSPDLGDLVFALQLERPDHPTVHDVVELEVATDGSFASAPLRADRYDVVAVAYVRYRHASGSSGAVARLGTLASIEVPPTGDPSPLELDASAFRVTRLRGRIVLDGASVGDDAIRIVLDRARGGRWGQFVPDASGAFVIDDLLPGRYRVGILTGDVRTGRGTWVGTEPPLVVEGAETVIETFTAARRRVRLRFATAAGEPIRIEHSLWLQAVDLPAGTRQVAANDDGTIDLDWVTPGTYRAFLPFYGEQEFSLAGAVGGAAPADVTVRVAGTAAGTGR